MGFETEDSPEGGPQRFAFKIKMWNESEEDGEEFTLLAVEPDGSVTLGTLTPDQARFVTSENWIRAVSKDMDPKLGYIFAVLSVLSSEVAKLKQLMLP